MKKKIAKVVSLALASTMLAGSVATMTGCNKKGKERPVVAGDSEWYDTTKITLESPYDKEDVSMVEFDSPVYLNDSIYVLLNGQRTFDVNAAANDENFDYNEVIISSICKYDLTGKLVKEYPLSGISDNDAMQGTKLSVENGNIKVTCLGADVDSDSTSNFYAIIDPKNGEVIDTYDVNVTKNDLSMINDEVQVGDYTVYSIYDLTGDDISNKLVVTNGEDIVNEIDVNKVAGKEFWNIGNFVVIDDNTLIMTCYGDELKTGKLTVSTGKLTLEDENTELSDYYFTIGQNGVSAAVNSQGVWKVNSEIKPERVMSFSNAYCNAADAGDCQVSYLDDNTVVLFGYKSNGSMIPESYIYLFTKAETNPNEGKMILDVYSLKNSISYSEAEAIVKFNSTNEDYFAEISFAEDTGDLDETTTITDSLMVDLMSGDGPDVVLNGGDIAQLNNEEYFLDLNKFIDGENGIDRSQYYDAIFKGATNSDGALYQIPITFSVKGILAYKKDVASGKTGFTYDEYIKFVDEVCNGKNPLEFDQSDYMVEMISVGAIQYIKDGKVNFDTAEFRKLAEFTNDNVKLNPEVDDGGMFGGMDILANGAAYYEAATPLYFFGMLSNCKDHVGLYGFPSSNGAGASAEIISSAAISANVDEETQAAAWDFVKAMLSEDVQISETEGNPMNKAAAKVLTNQGIEVYNEQYNYLISMGMNAAMLQMYGVSLMDESFADDYLDILDGVSTVYFCDTAVSSIVYEEMGAYFAGQKSLDDVIKTLNNRAQTVINERATI